MTDTMKDILKEYVNGLIYIIGEELNKVILYGSYARGEQNLDGEISDIDIMILVNKDDCDIKVLQKKVLDYSYDFDLKYDILLSPIVETTENYNKRLKYMAFYKKVQAEGVLLNG
ncbi:MAG: nucleotidyltransferase domain-containing protein [Clostridia bacterium]|nr:nucleotidyltransferase domain-containing protein [Clostridia bacterium]